MPVLFGRLPIARLIAGDERMERLAGIRDFSLSDMAQQADTALEPVKARVEDHIDQAGNRRGCDTALEAVQELLRFGPGVVLIARQRGVQAAVFVPIAIVGVMEIM